jgi:hypothetical protein
LVDVSLFANSWQSAVAYATTQLLAAQPGPARLVFTTFGPAEVWLNGQRVAEVKEAGNDFNAPQTAQVDVELAAENQLLVRFGQSGLRGLALAFALRIQEQAGSITVRLGTKARYPRRHYLFEQAFDQAFLESVTNYRGASFNLHYSQGVGSELTYAYHITDKDGMIYVEGTGQVDPNQVNDVGHTVRLNERPYFVTLRAPGREYWEQDNRYEMNLPIYVVDNDYSVAPGGDYGRRRMDALNAAAKRDGQVYGLLARMALDQWDKVAEDALSAAIARVAHQPVNSSLDLLGLVSIATRYADHEQLPRGFMPELSGLLVKVAFQPGQGTPSEQLVLLAAELLAGQLLPGSTFADGRTGQAHCQSAGDQAAAWMRQAGQMGFSEWDSPAAFERITSALAHITSFAQDEGLRDLSAVLLDKVLFLLAVNSYKGGLSGTHGSTEASMLRTTQRQATAGICRLLWGTGTNNLHTAGAVSLALADYEFPTFFSDIASDPAEFQSRERIVSDGVEVNKVIYRTADTMLASAQDYHAGQPGWSEHIWQATLSPDAVVFSNAPANFGNDEAHTPGFWLGNAALPRVAQWKNALVAVYQLPESSWLDFTHAYFPTYEFEEFHFEGGWAFARKGEGYLALSAANGFELIGRVPDGQRELRSPGRSNTWICQMGRATTDGDFMQFRQSVLALPLEWRAAGVAFTTLRGEELSFGWQGPLQIDGQEQALGGFAHIDSPFCHAELPASKMDITHAGTVMQLDFS